MVSTLFLYKVNLILTWLNNYFYTKLDLILSCVAGIPSSGLRRIHVFLPYLILLEIGEFKIGSKSNLRSDANMQLLHVALLTATIFIALVTILLNSMKMHMKSQPSFKRTFPLRNPWDGVPEFVLYLRLTSSPRFEQEYRNNLVRTMKLFFPPERAKLVVVLDNEKKEDHLFGDKMKTEWPYPQICYRDPSSIDAYRGWGKARMFWDMMYPDKCTNVSYVGYVDTDTFFSTLVTPQLLFDNGKPIIIAKIGQVPYQCWAETTKLFLGKKEVMQCMSTFPVMIKTEHMIKMREFIARNHSMDFDSVFKNTPGTMACLCQFSIMCNYVWYYHRNEYSWRLQMVPNGDWRGEHLLASQVSLDYYRTNVPPEMTIPMPRSSIHLRYTITNGQSYDSKVPPKEYIEDFIKEGLCYSAGFDVCPESCKKWNQAKIHYHLYSFEFYQWFWDKRCKEEQDKHYRNVKELVRYYASSKMEVFGLSSLDQLCTIL
ncbi:uncharacterized protein LOC135683365 isoform X1 [Rhopilema esculentum]|uniref:uncharacterized protein LOC135683365 isoform X1 n=1 Tax=Rhopilema esculentum TaxID=499914 RepID=UPI0031DCACB3